jgi:hypothetical protein
MVLSEVETLNGILSIIVISISIVIGLTIISKYFKYKQTTLIYIGISWIGIFTPWLSSAISFLSVLATNEGLGPESYFIIGGISATVVVYFWTSAFCYLTSISKKVEYIMTIETAILEIIYLYFVFTNPLMIGQLTGPVDVQYKAFGALFFVNLMIIFISTTTIFGLKSLKSEKPEIKLKGKFLLIGAYLFIIGAFLDTAIQLNLVTLSLVRIILIVSGFAFYCGFVLPNFLKKIFLKES